jgi:hypothetical protein
VGISFWLYLLTGSVFAIRAWRLRDLDRRSRRAWGVVAAAYLLFFASATLRPQFPLGANFPSPADNLRLLFMPVMLAALLMLPLRAQGRGEPHKVSLDIGMVSVASVMLVWFVETGSGGAPPASASLFPNRVSRRPRRCCAARTRRCTGQRRRRGRPETPRWRPRRKTSTKFVDRCPRGKGP